MTSFLRLLAGAADDVAIFARNFLLDEGVCSGRLESYRASGAARDHPSFGDWQGAHKVYLTDKVFLPGTFGDPPTDLDPADPDLCPDTFRFASSPFSFSSGALHLVRLVSVTGLDDIVKRGPDTLLAMAHDALAGSPDDLDAILAAYGREAQLRPVFAGFWEDVKDLFGSTPADDRPGWAEELRDRLGLAQQDPGQLGGAIDILVFRYPVATVPGLEGMAAHARPLTVPTVLDGAFSSAFCPAPAGGTTGHTVHLSDPDCNRLCREVLHPARRFRAAELWRIGRIARAVRAEDLPTARALHLDCLRLGRPDYGNDIEAAAP